MPQTSPAIEDYLKTVYAHTEWQPDPVTPKVLAGKLGVAPSSVTEMVKKMAAAGLVSHVPYGAIRLTDAGRERALAVTRRHRLIETWLVREMGYAWDEVHDEAEILEHAISDRLLDALDSRLGRPERDPHGDAIPTADGRVPEVPAATLAELQIGATGRVIRISDRDPELLRRLEHESIGPDVVLSVTGADAAGTRTVALAGDRTLTLDAAAAAVIWLVPAD
ncbi:metal-dependent transcriptional regulator [Agromyces archimandritae]|uniref:Manganese transport regulator n=1 Tax=Agromyces archimandritae TaxID=2781962 RepID=A0A975FQJ3_9MICO|nr:metal-dependent transcriptional regulator [Agromyces archimandritae]QTX05878.1 metal-dependent transcriptional regulator [Agromyces archimandritae]